jgi:hypothetical protein
MNKNRLTYLAASMVLLAMIDIVPHVWAQSGCVCATCGRSCNAISTQGHKQGYSCYVAPKSAPDKSGGTHHYGYSPQAMMMQAIMQPMFNNLFNPPTASGGLTAEQLKQIEQQRIEAEKARQAAEKAKNDALQKWAKAQSDEEIRKQVEQQEKLKRGEKVLSQMQPVGGGGGKLEPFSFGSPKLELQPIEKAWFPPPAREFDRLMCSAFFSNMARQSGSAVDAKFYSDQAERVMSGQPTYIECRVPKASGEAMAARTKAAKKIYEEANLKIQELDKIEIKLSEASEKVAAATSRKEEAATKVKELEARAAETPAEQKPEVDDLTAKAMKELADAEKELGQAEQSQKELAEKKTRIENDLNGMKSKMQAGLQAE